MSEYRYAVNSDGTIQRGRMVCLRDQGGYDDMWSSYWEGSFGVAFYDEGFRGTRVVDGIERVEDAERAIRAYQAERDYAEQGALARLAHRLEENAEADFVLIHLDRGTDLYVLSYDGDPDREMRDEIENIWHGEVYRCEVETYTPGGWFDNGDWTPADDMCEEWYGADNAEAGLLKEFDLAEFPAERVLTEAGA